MEKLELRCGGFCFDNRAQFKVYSPSLVLEYLKDPGRGLSSSEGQWFEGRLPLARLLAGLDADEKEALRPVLAEDGVKICDAAKLMPCIPADSKDRFPALAVLYQSGLLTLKKPAGPSGRVFEAGIPNAAAREFLAAFLN